ncbi:MAG TPA: type VI secretion system baseplate subunit TssE, partial [Thermoanaerobaculia bacterium]|nr:type VI secretion system baseplate subunit TssE [Thermoanaerobaculia bacterium]
EQLFNTRCPIPAHRLASRPRTVIDYGIPDFSTFSAREHNDRARLAIILRKAIEVYEPRLSNVRVEIEPIVGNDFKLNGTIAADLVIDGVPEPVLFETALQIKEGTVQVA